MNSMKSTCCCCFFCTQSKSRRIRHSPTSSSSSLGFLSKKFVLVCSCLYLLSATGTLAKKRFLRASAAALATADASLVGLDEVDASPLDLNEGEEFSASSSVSDLTEDELPSAASAAVAAAAAMTDDMTFDAPIDLNEGELSASSSDLDTATAIADASIDLTEGGSSASPTAASVNAPATANAPIDLNEGELTTDASSSALDSTTDTEDASLALTEGGSSDSSSKATAAAAMADAPIDLNEGEPSATSAEGGSSASSSFSAAAAMAMAGAPVDFNEGESSTAASSSTVNSTADTADASIDLIEGGSAAAVAMANAPIDLNEGESSTSSSTFDTATAAANAASIDSTKRRLTEGEASADAAMADAPVDLNEGQPLTTAASSSTLETTAEATADIATDATSSSSSSTSSVLAEPVTEPSEEEEFDYETYHARHHIPVPALGATMMGLMNTGESTSSPPELEEDSIPKLGGILAFAGTNMAMKNFASSGRMNLDDDDDDDWIEEEESSIPNNNNNAILYETTLAQISLSRASLLWGSDSDENEESREEKSSNDGDDGTKLDSTVATSATTNDSQGGSSSGGDNVSSENGDSANDAAAPLPSKQLPKIHKQELSRTDTDLDRGRHLVGLEVRDVRPHQQIIIDYASNGDDDASSEEDDSGSSLEDLAAMRPLRIRYLMPLSPDDDTSNKGNGNENKSARTRILEKQYSQLLSTLLVTSFSNTATLWSQALSLPPVLGGIAPTITTCGGATIPPSHRETGVGDADILIYVSGDNRFCGGALMHSAICDYDQHMRPLVANINICTKNIPTITPTMPGEDDGGIQQPLLQQSVLNEYESYISTETSRILGASTSLFQNYHNPATDAPYGATKKHNANCVDGTTSETAISIPNIIAEEIDDANNGQVYYEIRTPKVIEVVRNHFDCMTMTGARLEAKKGSVSCFGGFLDERLFLGEQASGFQLLANTNQDERPAAIISPLTLALLEDSSWYMANYTISTEMSFGRGAGCQFAQRGGCAVDENGFVQEDEDSMRKQGFHCADIGTMGCDVSHSSKAKCDLLHPATPRHVFTDVSAAVAVGLSTYSSSLDDFCPMYVRAAIDCADEGNMKKKKGSPSSVMIPGEEYGKSSKCFRTDQGQPICLKGVCNKETQTIDVHYEDGVFVCSHDGEIIDTHKNGLRIECPRLAAVCPHLICPSNCSGRGVCDEDREGKHTCICDDPFDESPGCWGQ
ncbi:hypothetical protein ACHAXR_013124 [Thalassiosira sp. AJA248-18]